MRSPTGAWRRGVRVLSARGGENECQSMSEPGAERQHCTSNTWFPPLSKSLPIVSTLPLNEDSFSAIHATDTTLNTRHDPGTVSHARRTFFPRGASLLCFSCFALIFARLFRKVSVVGIKGQLNLPRDFFKQRKCSECLGV